MKLKTQFMALVGLWMMVLLIGPKGFVTMNNHLYGHALRSLPVADAGPLLVVELTEDTWTPEVLSEVEAYVYAQGGKQLVVMDPPPQSTFDDRVLVGQTVTWDRVRRSWAVGDNMVSGGQVGLMCIPLVQDGIVRELPLDIECADRPAPVLAAQLAERCGVGLPRHVARLDFRVSETALQVIHGDRLLERALPSSVLAEQIVVLACAQRSPALVQTPRHRDAGSLSPTLFHAATLDAAVRGGVIRDAPTLAIFGIPLVLALAWLAVVGWRPQIPLPWVLGGLLSALAVGTWLSLYLGQTWFPPGQSFGLLVGAGLFEGIARQRRDDQTLRCSLMNLSAEMQERANLAGLLSATSPWMLLERIADQICRPSRSVFLRLDAGRNSLAPTSSEGAEIVHEVLDAAPLDLDHPQIAVSLLPAVPSAASGGVTVLPVRDGDRVHGFWAFTPPETLLEADHSPYIQRALELSERMGRLLSEREAWQELQGGVSESPSPRAGRLSRLPDQLTRSIRSLEESRDMLANALDGSRDAVLVFDSFGQVLHQSESSFELLATRGLDFDDLDPLRLLENVSTAETDIVQQTLGLVMLRQEEAILTARDDLLEGRRFLIRLRPMGAGEQRTDSAPALPGVLILFQDITQLERAAVLKDEFVERLIFQLNNDFESIGLAADLFAGPPLSEDERIQLSAMLSEKVDLASGVLIDARKYLQESLSPVPHECYPVRFSPLALAALAGHQSAIDHMRLRVLLNLPSYARLVLASPKPLEGLLSAMVHLLLEDAREESELEVSALEHVDHLEILLRNQGFGFPQEMMDRHVNSPDNDIEEFRQVAAGRALVQEWGGELEARSQVGEGLSFIIKLRAVI